MKRLLLLLLCLCPAMPLAAANDTGASVPGRGQVLWDRYGVPHVYARDEAGLFYGFGWSQARSHGDLLLRVYGEARGRAAEYWGGKYEAQDRWLLSNDVYERARQWYRQQPAQFRADLDAFAQGINDYAARHPREIGAEVRVVLPVSAVDVVAHAHRLMNFTYVVSPNKVFQGSTGSAASSAAGASNGWAVMPSRTRDGHAMLLANPHLSWTEGVFRYYEAHLVAPGVDIYGATQVGLPVMRFAFNPDLGYTHTVNTMLGYTNYALELADGGYRFDGKMLPFHSRSVRYRVRQADGSVQDKLLQIRSSVQGTVFTRDDGRTVALRVAGLDRPGALLQYWKMSTARDFAGFQQALRMMQVPMFNIVYADRAGHAMFLDNGLLPKHPDGDLDHWRGLVPGDTSATLWTELHGYDDLPKVIDPPGGFVQNANDPPWNSTWPAQLHASDFPAYVAAPGPYSLRAQTSLALLREHPQLDFEQLVRLKTTTRSRLADRVLGQLLPAAAADTRPLVRQAGQVLARWDRDSLPDSRGALLFERWALHFAGPTFSGQGHYARKWSADDPQATPAGIADVAGALDMLEQAAQETVQRYGSLDRPFGEVSRFRIGEVDVPGSGGFGNTGAFHVITWGEPGDDGVRTPRHGETWVSMVEFSTPLKAVGLLSYGNSTQPGSAHAGDQLPLLSRRQYRTLWLSRDQVEANLEATDTLP
ncbi:penicillin acylase family protein [Stenotrophomonas sp. MMGLT7]|uniref:penicillin acylase family protein n=1 Tax=Stenotrophomonas sp. MMGLT7 TaxID=2901227 RepID=UPI001E5B1746|nr:penicillin acylase family protein [Stenotrophomonas sp. MMGLT7]MCD7098567.1 penicillin acylase family protein [Stenotrophomonas sp. MMGLT7]